MVAQYLEAENAYTEASTEHLKPFRDALYERCSPASSRRTLSVPVRRGDYFYYTRTEESKQYPIQCRRKGIEGAEEVLLNLNERWPPAGLMQG